MLPLVTCIGEGKGTWGHVARVINDSAWSDVFIVTTAYFSDKFKTEKKAQMIVVDKDRAVHEMVDELHGALKDRLSGPVAVNLVSGTGKEHMAIISSLMRMGADIRLVAQSKDGLKNL